MGLSVKRYTKGQDMLKKCGPVLLLLALTSCTDAPVREAESDAVRLESEQHEAFDAYAANCIPPMCVAQDPEEPFRFNSDFLSRTTLDPRQYFKTSIHRKLTPAEEKCSNAINTAIYVQDFLLQQKSAAHFDNCEFSGAMDYVDSRVAEADVYLSKSNGDSKAVARARLKLGLFAIGQALHAIQDFYAHSNYVELSEREAAYATSAMVPTIPIWTAPGRATVEQLVESRSLISGTWALGLPKKCPVGTSAHGDVNKDSNTSGEGKKPTRWNSTNHEVAYGLARRASQEFLLFGAERWPILRESCGVELGVLPGYDQRR
jgi:hypothetical protein